MSASCVACAGLGFGVAFVGSGPAGCLYFTTYEVAKTRLLSIGPVGQSPFLAHFTAGLLAEIVSCALWVPIGTCVLNGSPGD
jgi:hypothetical protein